MTRSEPELWDRLSSADGMGHGEAQQALIEEVVRHADAQGLAKLAFTARRDLANAYCVDRQWHKAFPLFSRCLSDYDARPWQFGAQEDWQLRHWYTSIAQSMAEFPEISLDQIYDAFTDMERRFAAGGHNLREVHAARRWVAQLACDWEEEERCYHQWLAAGGPAPDSVWDFEAGVERLVFRGDPKSEAAALELARPALDGRMTFRQPVAPIQRLLMLPLARNGETAEAVRAYRRSMRTMNEGVYRYEYAAMAVEFTAAIGDRDRAVVELRRFMGGFATLNRPSGRMEFAAAGAFALNRFDPETEGTELIGRTINDEPDVTINQLREELTAVALDLAAKFDARNGTTRQGDRIRAKLRQRPLDGFVPLTPTQRLKRRWPVPAGLDTEQLLDRAEWHLRGGEPFAAEQHLTRLPSELSPLERARVTQLRAHLDGAEHTESGLSSAAEQYRRLGDQRRYLLCQCELAKFLAGHGDPGGRAHTLAARAVEQLHASGDRWATAWGEYRLAQVHVELGLDGEYDVLDRALALAAESGDQHAIGVMSALGAHWRGLDKHPANVVLDLALTAREALVAVGAWSMTIVAFNALKLAIRQIGKTPLYDDLVETQLAELPDDAPVETVGHLRYERGEALLRDGRFAEALPHLTEGVASYLQRGGARAEHWFHLAKAAYFAGEPDQAVEAAEKAADWSEDEREDGTLRDVELADHAQLILARSYRELGLGKSATETYEKLLTQAREYDSRGPLAMGLAESAVRLAEIGEPAEAVSRLTEAARLHRGRNDEDSAHRCEAVAEQLRPYLNPREQDPG